ncbi:hypothetical protein HJG60_007752 [Phyllostomus discolor]|uniref:Uncharacterized protein n=1 Tax=Phyllostomus discolor TaxID=89673 RepID=A0A834EVJ1_9CHIR|nr:hypothetical protein HJG60_007752 [Phyllostomus discolor]
MKRSGGTSRNSSPSGLVRNTLADVGVTQEVTPTSASGVGREEEALGSERSSAFIRTAWPGELLRGGVGGRAAAAASILRIRVRLSRQRAPSVKDPQAQRKKSNPSGAGSPRASAHGAAGQSPERQGAAVSLMSSSEPAGPGPRPLGCAGPVGPPSGVWVSIPWLSLWVGPSVQKSLRNLASVVSVVGDSVTGKRPGLQVVGS